MLRTHVLVAATSKDIAADLISEAIARSTEMMLVRPDAVATSRIGELLAEVPASAPCALVLIGPRSASTPVATRWLRRPRRLVVVQVDVATNIVLCSARNVGLGPLLAALRGLLDDVALGASQRCGAGDPDALPMQAAQALFTSDRPAAREGAYADCSWFARRRADRSDA